MDHGASRSQSHGAQHLSLIASASASFEITYPFYVDTEEKSKNAIAAEAPVVRGMAANFPQNSSPVKDPSTPMIASDNQKSALIKHSLGMASTSLFSTPGVPVNSSNANSIQSVECTCSPCECTLPTQVPSEQKTQQVKTDDCFCDPCECTSFPPSASASKTVVADNQTSLLECHCSPCECTLPSSINAGGAGFAKIVTHNECDCSPCECSLPSSNVSSAAGVVRGPSHIPVDFQTENQILRNEILVSPVGAGSPVTVLQMRSTQVNATPTLQTDHSQTAPIILPYSYQTDPRQPESQVSASDPYGRVFYDNLQETTPGQMYYKVPSSLQPTMAIPQKITAEYARSAKPFLGGAQQQPYSNLPGIYGVPNAVLAPTYPPMQPGPAIAGEINQVLGQGFYNRLNFRSGGEKNGNFYICKSYNCDETVRNQDRIQKTFKDSHNQMGPGKDMSTLCCGPPKRRKIKSASTSCKGNKIPEVVLVREVYHFQKLPKVCQSRKRLCIAKSSGLCRPAWTNAYKYRANPCCMSRVHPPRPRQNTPCAVCKACACICGNQSAACSPKSSKVNQCWDNNSNACCGSNALKIARKLSCGCELAKKMPRGPVSLVREYLIQGNGASTIPISSDKCCLPQQLASYLQTQNTKIIAEKEANSPNSEQRELSKKAETSDSDVEKKKNKLITISKIPGAPADGTMRSSQSSVQRKVSGKGLSSVERRKMTNKQDRNQSSTATSQESHTEKAVEESRQPARGSDNTKISEEKRKNSPVAVSDSPDAIETERDDKNKVGQVTTDHSTKEGMTKSEASMNPKRSVSVSVRKASDKAITDNKGSEKQAKDTPLELRKDSTESIGWRNDDLTDFTASDDEHVEELSAIKSRFFDS